MIKRTYLLGILSTVVLLTACGKNNNEEYISQMQNFYDSVQETSASMNEIDTSNPEHSQLMIDYLDTMNQHFQMLSDIEIPEEYERTKPYVTNAGSYMNQAVTIYNQVLTSDVPDLQMLETAKVDYETAMNCIKSIGDILSGIQ